jgi:hypothetical protein
MEWLRQVLTEAADQLRAAVLWAASQASTASATNSRPLVIAADAARSDAALASYFLSFMVSERLIESGAANELAAALDGVESEMSALSLRLREQFGVDPYAPAATA